MTSLIARGLHWDIGTSGDSTLDQCAHGQTSLIIDGITFVAPEHDWNLTAASLQLVRTVQSNHKITEEPNNMIFPHCGFNVWYMQGKLEIMNCNKGVDFSVTHNGETVTIEQADAENKTISSDEWRIAVLAFVDHIKDFYHSEPPKQKIKDDFDRLGWEVFWKEFEYLRSHA